MKLENTNICLDCECVFDHREHDNCPDCGCRFSAPLSTWLGAPIRHLDAVKRIGIFNMHTSELAAEPEGAAALKFVIDYQHSDDENNPDWLSTGVIEAATKEDALSQFNKMGIYHLEARVREVERREAA